MPPKTPKQGLAAAVSSTPTTPQITYAFRDIVLAKVKGHPAWPARIVDPHTAPMNLRDERKIAQRNSYLVKFFKTADYAWMNAKEISKLDPTEIKAFIDNPNKKGADLRAAYEIALAPEAWEAELEAMYKLEEENNDEQENSEHDGEAPALPEPKTKQKRRRASEPKPRVTASKKRKSEVASSKVNQDQASSTPEPASAQGLRKRVKKKEDPPPVIDGQAIVKEWRHKLQRVFLSKAEATEKMMPEVDQVIKDIEAFEMKTEWLTSSKLAKVLKRVGVLDDSKVPMNDTYNFKSRARALQEKWRQTLGLGEEVVTKPSAEPASEAQHQISGPAKDNKENENMSAAKPTPEKALNGDTPAHPDLAKSSGGGADMDVDTTNDSNHSADPVYPAATNTGDVDMTSKSGTPENKSQSELEPVTVRDGDVASNELSPQEVDKGTNEGSPIRAESKLDGTAPPTEEVNVPSAEIPPALKSLADDPDDGEQMDCADSPEDTSAGEPASKEGKGAAEDVSE